MAKRRTKSFKSGVETALDDAVASAPALEGILNGIPIAGDDILAELLDATSDRTVEPPPLATADIMPVPNAELPQALPEDLGEETGAPPEFVERVEAIRQQTGRTLAEAEEMAKREMPQPDPAFLNPGMREVDAGQTEFEPAPIQALTPLDSELNTIAAQELVEWYDVLQSVAGVWAYDYFSTPKKAVQTVEELYPKISSGKANAGQNQ